MPDLDELLALFDGPEAARRYDESVSEAEHARQCAVLASSEGAPAALVAAALLHDVGHLLVRDLVPAGEALTRDRHHERAGATHLRRWFGPDVTEPVRLHVAAKRYLCATDPAYSAVLSPGSVRSLAVQGGPMTAAEVAEFEARPGSEGAVRVRRWDDRAKVPGLDVPPVAHWRPLLETLAG